MLPQKFPLFRLRMMCYVSVFSQPTRPTTPVMSVPPPKETVCSIAQRVKKEGVRPRPRPSFPLLCLVHFTCCFASLFLSGLCWDLIYLGSFEGGQVGWKTHGKFYISSDLGEMDSIGPGKLCIKSRQTYIPPKNLLHIRKYHIKLSKNHKKMQHFPNTQTNHLTTTTAHCRPRPTAGWVREGSW